MEFLGIHIHGTASEIFFSLIASLISFVTFAFYQGHVFEHLEKEIPLNEFPPIPSWCFMLNNSIWLVLALFNLVVGKSDSNGVPKAYYTVCLLFSSALGYIFDHMYLWAYAMQGPVIKNRLCTVLLYVFAIMGVFSLLLATVRLVPHTGFVIGTIVGIIMYASPLAIIIKCHKEESVKGLPDQLCVLLFLNGFAWFIVALAYKSSKFDVYLGLTNGVGAFLGILQLGIIYRLRNLSSNKIHADDAGGV